MSKESISEFKKDKLLYSISHSYMILSTIKDSINNNDVENLKKFSLFLNSQVEDILKLAEVSELLSLKDDKEQKNISVFQTKIKELEKLLCEKDGVNIKTSTNLLKLYMNTLKNKLKIFGFSDISINNYGILQVNLTFSIDHFINKHNYRDEDEYNKAIEEKNNNFEYIKNNFEVIEKDKSVNILFNENNKIKLEEFLKKEINLPIINISYDVKSYDIFFCDKMKVSFSLDDIYSSLVF